MTEFIPKIYNEKIKTTLESNSIIASIIENERKWKENIIRENMTKLERFLVTHINVKWINKFIMKRFTITCEENNENLQKTVRLYKDQKLVDIKHYDNTIIKINTI